MYIIGYSDSIHDRSVCLFRDTQPLVAIEEERLTRFKHGLDLYAQSRTDPATFSNMNLEGVPAADNEVALEEMVDYCLSAAGISLDQVDLFIGNSLHEAMPFRDRSIYLNHHTAHAAATYYASGFEDAAILVSDGYGDKTAPNRYETVILAHGVGNKIDRLSGVDGHVNTYYDMQNSLGVFYRIGTLLSGFGLLDEGKAMGLSAYGKPRYRDLVSKHIRYTPDSVEIDNGALWASLASLAPTKDDFDRRADMASTFQGLLEEMMAFYARTVLSKTGSTHLCIGGGVGLNCVSNAKIAGLAGLDDLFVFPATGDNGNSFGAAYYACHQILGMPRTPRLRQSYFGREYSSAECAEALRGVDDITFTRFDEPALTDETAQALAAGQIVMWFQGGCEIGPRALGHRSILASPADASIRDYINSEVKFREGFRPLAPMVLESRAGEFFEFDAPSPFMLFSPQVRKITTERAPAIVHVDGTARLQTIAPDQNALLCAVIERFEGLAGVPIVLNTSLNGKDEPIVETPGQAVDAFLASPVQCLVMGDLFVRKVI